MSLQVHTGDGLEWLGYLRRGGPREEWGAIATSPPDASELGMEVLAYGAWLSQALVELFESSSGPTVLILTDRKHDGRWWSKPQVAMEVAYQLERRLLWHRIALRRAVGAIDLHVPTYSHVLAFGPGRPGSHRPDVIEEGQRLWAHGVGLELAVFVAQWLASVGAKRLLDPFCGTGALLYAAHYVGLEAWGCELDPERAEQVRTGAERVIESLRRG